MSETALYRKYRPNTFKEVLGQDHIVSVLESAIKLGNISHAYLFAGSRGIGKTSVARIVAREIGTSADDLYEIDAASNRGIDDIRELRESVHTLPFHSKFKVYIIDEVHMLTKEAFNALLKTLEEPPNHVVFMLATTEADKLPETIISRCQVYTFRKPSQKILKDAVVRTAKGEGYTLESAAADLVALLAEGAFRDATGILQKIISSSSDKKISMAEVERVTGAPRGMLVHHVIAGIVEKDLDKALGAVSRAVEDNVDMKAFLKLILHKIRMVMLLRFAPDMEKGIAAELAEQDFRYLKDLAKRKDSNISSQTLLELLDAYDGIGRAYLPQLPLELALVRIANGV